MLPSPSQSRTDEYATPGKGQDIYWSDSESDELDDAYEHSQESYEKDEISDTDEFLRKHLKWGPSSNTGYTVPSTSTATQDSSDIEPDNNVFDSLIKSNQVLSWALLNLINSQNYQNHYTTPTFPVQYFPVNGVWSTSPHMGQPEFYPYPSFNTFNFQYPNVQQELILPHMQQAQPQTPTETFYCDPQ